jgi:hypothetical protein
MNVLEMTEPEPGYVLAKGTAFLGLGHSKLDNFNCKKNLKKAGFTNYIIFATH